MSDHAKLRRLDSEARRLARSEFVRPVALEAGAGTGKTATLVQRIVAWCLGRGFERQRGAGSEAPKRVLERLVAITFTEAAAAEMSERVARAFADLGAKRELPGLTAAQLAEELGLPLESLAERARAFAEASQHLRLSTIHSFAAELLLESPFQAGLHPRPTIDAEGEALRRVARETVEAHLRAKLGDPADDDWIHLVQQGSGPAEIEAELLRLLELGVQAGELPQVALPREAFERWRGAVLQALGPLRSQLEATVPRFKRSKRPREIQAASTRLAEELAADLAHGSEVSARVERLRALPELALLEQQLRAGWAKGEFNKEEQTLLADREALEQAARLAVRELAALRTFDPRSAAAALAVLGPMLAEAREQLDRRGVLSFDDLLGRASRLLVEQPEVLRRQRERLDQLLVDEFQDTDQRQCDLVAALALEGPAGSRPGLFVVGDPKQSIYAWRQADLLAYERFLERLEAAGGIRAGLSVNHRSSAAILAEVERVLTPAMRAEAGLQPPFVPLVTPEQGAKPETQAPAGRAAVSYWWTPEPAPELAPTLEPAAPAKKTAKPRLRSSERVSAEAEAFAWEALRLHREAGVPCAQMALLLRSTGDQERYLEALRSAGVPYQVARDKSYYRRREVIEAAAWVRLVFDPTDSLALVTWLRSPAVGVPDAALEPLWRCGFPAAVQALAAAPEAAELERLAQLVDAAARQVPPLPGLERIAAWPASLCSALASLGELRGAAEQLPAERFVELLRRLSLQEFGAATRFLGHFARANLERFHGQLERRLLDGRGDVEALLGSLRDQVALAKEAEEARPRGQARDALSVLTIHKAKGLDFQVVFLGQTYKDLTRGRRGPPVADFVRTADGPEWRLFKVASLGHGAELERRERRERAEWVRLLYVAMTRAKARLVIGVRDPEARSDSKGDSEGKRDSASSLEALIALDRRHPKQAERPPEGLELAPLPAGPREAEPGPARAAGSTPPPGLPAQRERRAAERRESRPLTASASEAGDPREGELGPSAGGAEPPGAEARALAPADAEAQAALAVGARLHALLEGHRPGDQASGRFAARARELLADLQRELPPQAQGPALARAEALLEALQRGPLLAALERLEPAIVARELPLLAPPEAGDLAPIGPYTGTLDLLYRDGPLWVVADFKTDRIKGAPEAAAQRYGAQLGRYLDALRQALDLPPEQVCAELWWLESGRVQRLTDPRAPGASA